MTYCVALFNVYSGQINFGSARVVRFFVQVCRACVSVTGRKSLAAGFFFRLSFLLLLSFGFLGVIAMLCCDPTP